MKLQFSDKVYNVLKWVAQIFLPGFLALYLALAGLWGWPYTEQIGGTIAALTTFLGILLGVSTSQYRKATAIGDGTLLIDRTSDPNTDLYRIDLGENFEKIGEKDTVTLKVNPHADLSEGRSTYDGG